MCCRFKSYLLPMLWSICFLSACKFNNLFCSLKDFLFSFIFYFNFLPLFFNRIELVWQEGLLLDFLQKVTCNLWMRKFLIYASYLFNERLVFDNVIRFFLDFVLWPLHYFNFFEGLHIMWVLIIILGSFILLFNTFILLYLFL